MNHAIKPLFASLSGLLLLAAAPARMQAQPSADVTLPLNITVSLAVQQDDVTSGANSQITKHSTKPVKWTSENLISMLGTNLGVSFPPGSILVLAGGTPMVQDKQGNQTDVSSSLTIDTGSSVTTGQDNSDTGAFNDVATTYIALNFDDGNSNVFTLTGMARIVSSSTATSDANGNPLNATESYSITFAGVGYGSVGAQMATCKGSVAGKGTFKQSGA